MDLSFSPQEEQFRTELRTWLARNPPGPEPEDLGEWVRYGTPGEDGAEYIAVCLPAFAPATVHRDS